MGNKKTLSLKVDARTSGTPRQQVPHNRSTKEVLAPSGSNRKNPFTPKVPSGNYKRSPPPNRKHLNATKNTQEKNRIEDQDTLNRRFEAARKAKEAEEARLKQEIELQKLKEAQERLEQERLEQEHKNEDQTEVEPAKAKEEPVQDDSKKPTLRTDDQATKSDGETKRKKRSRGNDTVEDTGRPSDQKKKPKKFLPQVALDDDDDGFRPKSRAAFLRREERRRRQIIQDVTIQPREKVIRDVQLPETIVVQELANRMSERSADVVKKLIEYGIMVTQNQTIDAATAEIIIDDFGHNVVRVADADVEDVIESVKDDPQDLKQRYPVIAVMGHVDHGKTTLLDTIRKTNIAAGEEGGITQHIGAYQVATDAGHKLTFLDTPGHAAFTAMRERGANVTDIAVIVVAADDAVMPQTIEAINHAKAAKAPIIIAINKCDRPNADPDKVRNQLLQHDIVVEKLSGDVLDVEISALKNEGINELLETITLQAELMELKANPDRVAQGTVIEAKLDVGRGPVATLLVQHGTLKRGDIFVVGEQWGKVRALIDDQRTRIDTAGPSTPVEVLGINGTPHAGDVLNVVENEAQAREIARFRQQSSKDAFASAPTVVTLENMLQGTHPTKDLQLVIKADVQGSAEAINQALTKIGNEEVQVRIIHSGVGAITESDVSLAASSGAYLIGFNVRGTPSARLAATKRDLVLRYYSVIYRLVEDITSMASGLLDVKINEIFLGNAKILETFKITGAGMVAGCMVTDGTVKRSAKVRLLRDNVVIHEGKLKTLKRFQDEVNEVVSGQECGMAFENYSNIKIGDIIEVFEEEEIQQTL